MAYVVTNPPVLVRSTLYPTGVTRNLWSYNSADASATIDASGYITDGYVKGMADGDRLEAYDTANKIWSSHTVTVSGTTVNLSDGSVIGSSTNSD